MVKREIIKNPNSKKPRIRPIIAKRFDCVLIQPMIPQIKAIKPIRGVTKNKPIRLSKAMDRMKVSKDIAARIKDIFPNLELLLYNIGSEFSSSINSMDVLAVTGKEE